MPRYKYKAVLFSPDGDWVSNFKAETPEEVMDLLADKGSRWYFYPFEGIILHKEAFTRSSQRVLNMAPPLEFLTGRSIEQVSRWLEGNPEEVEAMLRL